METPPEAGGGAPVGAPDPDVQARLRRIRATGTSTTNKILLLVVTLLIFGALASWEPLELILIVGVLLFHEAGHAVAMKAFGYRDVSVFFIPFLGAAASGRKEAVPHWQAAVVSLAGPLPGAFLGLLLLWVNGWAWQEPMLDRLALFLVLINLFNLVPFVPFDGGRFFNELIFGRHRALEAIFGALSAAAVAALAIWARDWVLGVVAYLALIAVLGSYKVRAVAEEVTRAGVRLGADLPDEALLDIDGRLAERFPAASPRARIGLVQRVLASRPGARAGAGATLGLLVLYLAPLAAGAATFLELRATGGLGRLVKGAREDASQLEWQELAPPGLGFRISLPGRVVEQPAMDRETDAGPVQVRTFLAEAQGSRLAAMVQVASVGWEDAAEPGEVAGMRDQLAASFGARDAVHSEIVLAGRRAWRTVFTFEAEATPGLTMRCEAVLLAAGRRTFLIALYQPRDGEDPAIAARLFGSLRLASEPPGPRPAPDR